MPEIPVDIGIAPVSRPPTSPEMFALPATTLEKTALQEEQVADYGIKVFGHLYAINQKAMVEEKAAKLDNLIDAKAHDISFQIGQMTDYNQIDKFLTDNLKTFEKEMKDQAVISSGEGEKTPIPLLEASVEKAVTHYSSHLRTVAEVKKAELIERNKMFDFDAMYQQTLNKYINESNPTIREALKSELQLKSLAINSPYALNKVMQFDQHADESQYRLDISKNPLTAFEKINEVDEKGNYKNYTNLDPTKRAELTEHNLRVLDLQDQIAVRQYDLKEKIHKENAETVITNLNLKSMKGLDIQNDLQVLAESGVLNSEEVKSVLNFEKTWTGAMKQEDARENEALKSKLALGIYGQRITTTESELTAALNANAQNPGSGINAQTYREFLSHATTRKREDRLEAKSDLWRDYENGMRDVMKELTTTGPLEKLDPVANTLQADAMREYYKLVFKDKIPVNDAVARITDKYTKALATQGLMDTVALRKTLPIPNSATAAVGDMAMWLDQNKGKMASATYDQMRHAILRIKAIEQAQEEARKQKVQKQKPTSEGGEGGY